MSDPLLDDIRTLPTGYQEHLDTALPALPALPADTDAAQIVCGQLAQYLLDVFGAFAGLHPLKIPYLMGQGNEAVLGLLRASIKKNANYADFTIEEPVDGVTYAPGENSISIRVTAGTLTDISCTVYPPSGAGFLVSEFSEIETSVWLATIDYTEIGTYDLTFVARFGEAIKAKSIQAEVA